MGRASLDANARTTKNRRTSSAMNRDTGDMDRISFRHNASRRSDSASLASFILENVEVSKTPVFIGCVAIQV
jgi:hypothetical protein